MLCYCERCGRIVQEIYGKQIQTCDCCNHILQYVPEKYLGGKSKLFIKDDLKDEFIEKYIKSSLDFDQSWFDRKDKIRAERNRQWNTIQNSAKEQNCTPKCPYCNSTNLKKIGTFSRMASVGFFGLASSKIGKQWHCNKCGSDF